MDPVDRLDRFDPALEHREQCAIVALVRRELARDQRGPPPTRASRS